MRHVGTYKKMTEKSGLLSVTGITKYEGITSEMVQKCYHIVQLRIPSNIHIVAGKHEHLCIH